MYDFPKCSKEEALAVMRDRSVLRHLAFYPEDIKDWEIYRVGNAVVVVSTLGNEAEVHMACKYRDRALLKLKLTDFLKWLRCRGYSLVFTTAPDERIALINMLKSLGFSKSEGRWVWA